MNTLVCQACKEAYPLDEPRWRCDCGGVLDLDFEAVFDLTEIERRPPNLWRYREAIPIRDDANIVSFGEGFTPLVEVDFAGRPVLVKQDQLFPSGSFKDRGATVMVSKLKELGIRRVVEDSSGNAGCAVAAYCANAGIDCEIFVPADTSAGKLAQIQMYGARLNRVPGSREDTASAALAAAEQHFYASHVWNPFFYHGTKTFAYEVAQQLGWRAPDTVITPVGHGSMLLGAYTGFSDLKKAGIISRLPRLIGVQSASCAPLYEAFARGLKEAPPIEKKKTLAEGIAIAEPLRARQILDVVAETEGMILPVEDGEIEEALVEMCRQGFYIEPTSAAAVAGIYKYLPRARNDELIVSVFTGHGLKATEKMLKLL